MLHEFELSNFRSIEIESSEVNTLHCCWVSNVATSISNINSYQFDLKLFGNAIFSDLYFTKQFVKKHHSNQCSCSYLWMWNRRIFVFSHLCEPLTNIFLSICYDFGAFFNIFPSSICVRISRTLTLLQNQYNRNYRLSPRKEETKKNHRLVSFSAYKMSCPTD